MREERARALVAEPRLELVEAAREHVVGLDIVIGGGFGGRRGQVFHGRGRRGGQHLAGAAGGEALQVRDQVGELAERQIRIARHGRVPVGPDVAWPVDQDGVGGEDRLDEVLGGVMAAHAGQLRARAGRRRKRLAGDAVAGGAAGVGEGPPSRPDVARGHGEAPAGWDTARLMERRHRDAHRADRRALGGRGRRLLVAPPATRGRHRQRGGEDDRRSLHRAPPPGVAPAKILMDRGRGKGAGRGCRDPLRRARP